MLTEPNTSQTKPQSISIFPISTVQQTQSYVFVHTTSRSQTHVVLRIRLAKYTLQIRPETHVNHTCRRTYTHIIEMQGCARTHTHKLLLPYVQIGLKKHKQKGRSRTDERIVSMATAVLWSEWGGRSLGTNRGAGASQRGVKPVAKLQPTTCVISQICRKKETNRKQTKSNNTEVGNTLPSLSYPDKGCQRYPHSSCRMCVWWCVCVMCNP